MRIGGDILEPMNYIWSDPRLADVTFKVNARVQALEYPQSESPRWWCQCPGCLNYREASKEHYPSGLASALKSLAIDPFDPSYLTTISSPLVKEGWRCYVGIYMLWGELYGPTQTDLLFEEEEEGSRLCERFSGADHTQPVFTDEGCWFAITSETKPLFRSGRFVISPYLTVVAAVTLPWVRPPEEEYWATFDDLEEI